MSYDLYFLPPKPTPLDDLARWLADRPHKTKEGTSFLHDNPETRVHFQWDVFAPEPGEGPEDPLTGAQLCLSIHYNRPSPFVREAAREAAAFARAFDLAAIDPQSGDRPRPFHPDRLVRDYVATSARITRDLHDRHDIPFASRLLPTAELDRIWEWNDAVPDRQAALGRDIGVLRIRTAGGPETPIVFTTWTDGAPALVPRVQAVMILRDRLAPRRGVLRRRGGNHVEILDWDSFTRAFADHMTEDHASGGFLLGGRGLAARVDARTGGVPFDGFMESYGLAPRAFPDLLDAEWFVAS